jgi:cytochrome o ubiquinol oxidase subunit 1
MLWFMGFVVLFTLGGVAGVVLAEPPADYQLHNSLFLVAHFHTMIVAGVLFGYFAGLTFWFPKFFGFMLDERWGRRAFWLWLWGFILAFGPLYILGMMGATRRLDHYSNLGWQPLFLVAGVGALLIALGFISQVIQLTVSVKRRTALAVGPDPWGGRSLEWSVPTPPPAYNFASLPVVDSRDAFWAMKHTKTASARHEEIVVPTNSGAGCGIGIAAFFGGFGIVWHVWWLAAFALLAILVILLVRTFNEHTDTLLTL